MIWDVPCNRIVYRQEDPPVAGTKSCDRMDLCVEGLEVSKDIFCDASVH